MLNTHGFRLTLLAAALSMSTGVGCGDSEEEPSSEVTYESVLADCERLQRDSYDECTLDMRSIASLRDVREVCASSCSSLDGFTVNFNEELTNLKFLRGFRGEISASALIQENAKLTSLEGMEGFTEIYWLHILVNKQLTSLTALSNVENVDDLYVKDNTKLDSFNGLESLGEVNTLRIISNEGLTDIRALANLRRVKRAVHIEDNPNLDRCHIEAVLENVELPSDPTAIEIKGNGDGSCE